MKQFTHRMQVTTRGKGLYPVTQEIESWTEARSVRTGLLTVFIQHTSASLTIQENADPDVVRDLDEFFERLAPENAKWYRHTVEGPDDMPSHIRSMLTQTSLGIPLRRGHLLLGRWQGIYVFEHRDEPHEREVAIHIIGE